MSAATRAKETTAARKPPKAETGSQARRSGQTLTEADAIEIWIARWLRVRPIDLVRRYQCDSRRLYDIWWGKAFPAARKRAEQAFLERYPGAADRTAFGYRRIPRGGADPRQGSLFEHLR